MLLAYVLSQLLDTMRWALARKGISSVSFVQMGPGIGFFTVCFLTARIKLRNLPGLVK